MSGTHLRLESDRRQVTFAAALTLAPVLWFIRTDFAIYADDWPHLRQRFLLRAFAAAAAIATIWLLSIDRRPATYRRVVLGMALSVALYMVGMSASRPQGAAMALRTPLFNLFLLYAAFPNSYWRQCLPPLLMSGGLVALRVTWLTSEVGNDIAGDIVILAVSNVLGLLMVAYRTSLERQLGDAERAEATERQARQRAVEELRALREVIPICMHCKNVRSEIGEWHRIESYVKAHIDAEFTHGICPGCLARHYGEFSWDSQHP